MNRREFLGSVAAASVAASVPVPMAKGAVTRVTSYTQAHWLKFLGVVQGMTWQQKRSYLPVIIDHYFHSAPAHEKRKLAEHLGW